MMRSKDSLIDRIDDLSERLNKITALGSLHWEMAEAAKIAALGEIQCLTGATQADWWLRRQIHFVVEAITDHEKQLEKVDRDEQELFNNVDFPELSARGKMICSDDLMRWPRPKLKNLIATTKGLIKLRSKRTKICEHMIISIQVECKEIGIHISDDDLVIHVLSARALKDAVRKTNLEGYQ